jgi:hypothetical protein
MAVLLQLRAGQRSLVRVNDLYGRLVTQCY